MSTNAKERLSPKIIAELERLGCEVDSPDEVPEPRIVEFGGDQHTVPEGFRAAKH